MKVTKMQGCGNDYVYVNGFKEHLPQHSEIAKYVSDRHFGIGSDGLIFINPSNVADFEMEMYNADGSRGEMCGNGIRSVAKYVYDKGLTDKKVFTIETLAGIKTIEITAEDGVMKFAKVDMGSPVLEGSKIPSTIDQQEVMMYPLEVAGKTYPVSLVSMGNPHCIMFLEEDVRELELPAIGPDFESHPCFPKRINTEFANILDRKNIRMRVWERGSGETLACGTGACATAVAAIKNGLVDEKVTLHLLGGDLEIDWNQENGHVYMTGPATIVYDGEIAIPEEILSAK